MTKEFTSVVGGGEEGWSGSFAEFKEDLDDATACGFMSQDYECEWSADAERVLLTAKGLEHAFGKVEWRGRDGGRTILLVVG